MMNRYLVDTNILLLYLRKDSRTLYIDTHYNPFVTLATPIISVVTEGEIRSIALQRDWGVNKLVALEALLKKFLIADIHVKDIIESYAEIDAFSQGKLTSKPLGMSARSMGKNDLWIAATAHVLGLPLLTTDKDFHHLDATYLKLEYVDLNVI
jgi:tRNA(fMet)-specific endonuclease VapC